jgi:hypothetical protein
MLLLLLLLPFLKAWVLPLGLRVWLLLLQHLCLRLLRRPL